MTDTQIKDDSENVSELWDDIEILNIIVFLQ